MSYKIKAIIGIIIVALIAGGAYYYWSHQQATEHAALMDGTSDSGTLPSGTSATDNSLQQDTAAIDAQLKGLSSDSSSVNTSLDERSAVQAGQ